MKNPITLGPPFCEEAKVSNLEKSERMRERYISFQLFWKTTLVKELQF